MLLGMPRSVVDKCTQINYKISIGRKSKTKNIELSSLILLYVICLHLDIKEQKDIS